MTTDLTLYSPLSIEDRRRKLVETLRAGTYAPTRNSLFQWPLRPGLAYDKDFSKGPIGHCCIGVALRVGAKDTGITDDHVVGLSYGDFAEYYNVEELFQTYMIGMNDGSEVRTGVGEEGRCIRMASANGKNARSHAFIARWLEIVWGL
jgi:hypothetical protein